LTELRGTVDLTEKYLAEFVKLCMIKSSGKILTGALDMMDPFLYTNNLC